MNIQSISRDLWLLTNFRNGLEMVSYLRYPKLVSKATLLNGKTIIHPEKLGLVEAILELWYEQAYFPKGFYAPKPDDVIVDIGANIGLFTLQAAKINPHCRIAAFEPFPENFSCLSRNIDNFGTKKRVTVYQQAISNSYRQDLMADTGVRSLDHQLLKQSDINLPGSNYLPVDVIPLEAVFNIINTKNIALLKMDIEGAERDIFEYISPNIFQHIHSLAIEYHDNLRPGTLNIITEKLRPTHYVKTIPSNLSGCGVLFAVRQV